MRCFSVWFSGLNPDIAPTWCAVLVNGIARIVLVEPCTPLPAHLLPLGGVGVA
jgi:hypothetical protein